MGTALLLTECQGYLFYSKKNELLDFSRAGTDEIQQQLNVYELRKINQLLTWCPWP